jgi:hypothetical protein
MSDSNDTPVVPTPAPVDPTPAPVAPVAPPAPAPAKTYMERLLEMEMALKQHVVQITQQNGLIKYLSNLSAQLVEEITNLNDQLNALYDLHEAKQEISRTAINANLTKKIEDSMRKIISDRVANGALTKIDAVASLEDLFTYSSPEVPYAFRLVRVLEADQQKDVVGKKEGDLIGNMKILEVYRLNKKDAAPVDPKAPKTDAPTSN